MEHLRAVSPVPKVAFITDSAGPNPLSLKGEAIAGSANEIGISFDLLYIDDSVAPETRGSTRKFSLGEVRAAYATPKIVRYLRSERPSVLIVNSGQLGPAAVVAGRLAGVPVIPWETSFTDIEAHIVGFRKRVSFRLERVLYRWAAAIAAESTDMVDWIPEHRPVDESRTLFWPAPFDHRWIRESAADQVTESRGTLRLVAVGRLAEQKGYDVLIEALSLADPDLPEWRLDILGAEEGWKGGWEGQVRTMIERRGLTDRVSLLGLKENPFPDMARADLFVHAARWEHFGNVIVEAMSLGTPVLATSCLGGPHEILGEGRFGRLVPNEDPKAFAAAIVELANDPTERKRLGEAGRARSEDYSVDRLLPGMLADIERVVGVSFDR